MAQTAALPAPFRPTIAFPRRWLLLAAPGAVYLAVRAAGVLLLWAMTATNHRPLNLAAWDGAWYLAIAEHGYNLPADMLDGHNRHTAYTGMAFFPGYPWAVRAVAVLFSGRYLVAAIAVSVAAGVAAAYGVARLAGHVTGGSTRARWIALVLFAAAPMSIVYSMAYPEALLCALSAWALVGVLEKRWLLAGCAAFAAGFVRPTAAAIIAVVAVAAVIEALRNVDWFAAVAAVLAPLGLVSYWTWVAYQTGSITGYAQIQQAGWTLAFDGGVGTARWSLRTLTVDSNLFTNVVVWLVVAAVVLLIVGARRMPWPLWTYGLLIVALALGTSGVEFSKPRELLPAFGLLLPLAGHLARRRPLVAVTVTAALAVAGLWFSAYSLTVWRYAI